MSAEEVLRSADGLALHCRWAAPVRGVRGVLLVVHGYGEHVGRYTRLFARQTARGLAVAGLDLRGHGRSAGPRGHCRSVAEYVADVAALRGAAAARWPGLPQAILGHSMGGLVTLAFLLAHGEGVAAAVITCPALRVPPGAGAPRWMRWLARQLGLVAPGVPFTTDLDATALSRDPAVGEAYLADPLVHHRATAGFVRAIEAAQTDVVREAPRLFTPLLVLQGEADRLVDPAAAAELAARLTCPHECVLLPGYYHELLNEPEAERARVLATLDAWLDRWLSPDAPG